jgi:uncharacterized protein (TIGR04255 family)
MPLPRLIEPCPIVNALIELRYTPNVPEEAVFGVIYTRLALDFPNSEKLPILELPTQIRDVNPRLRFQPHYRLRTEGYAIAIGPKAFSLSIDLPYPGWTALRAKILTVYEALLSTNVVKQPLRLGLRYTNILPPEAFQDLTLRTTLSGEPVIGNKTFFKTEFQREPNRLLLQVGQDASVKRPPKKFGGTLIDIDVFRTPPEQLSTEGLAGFIDSAHDDGKRLFFELLGDKVLSTLNPAY